MRFLIVKNDHNAKVIDATLMLTTYLSSQGFDWTVLDVDDLYMPLGGSDRPSPDPSEPPADMAITLGGDGTILRTAQYTHDWNIPILGIDFGRLGFLANASDDGIVAIVADALAGDVVEEHRSNITIDVYFTDDEDEEPRSFFGLNEAAIARGSDGRIVDFTLSVAGSRLANMRGDGVVVATATGSTAYALSAGGPLVAPQFKGLVVVPICPHSIISRAVVTDSSDVVEVLLSSANKNCDPCLFVDGDLITFEAEMRRVVIRRGDCPTTLLRHKSHNFYAHIAESFFNEKAV